VFLLGPPGDDNNTVATIPWNFYIYDKGKFIIFFGDGEIQIVYSILGLFFCCEFYFGVYCIEFIVGIYNVRVVCNINDQYIVNVSAVVNNLVFVENFVSYGAL
jgi:hypothetical protein